MSNLDQYTSHIPIHGGPCVLCKDSNRNTYRLSSESPIFKEILPGIPSYGHPLTTELCSYHFQLIMYHKRETLQVFFPLGDFDNEQEQIKLLNIHTSNKVKELKKGLTVGRLSSFGDYKTLYKSLNLLGIRLINTPSEFDYIRNFEYYEDIKEFTPKTWNYNEFGDAPEGCYVVRGKWKSCKGNWKDLMFAHTKNEAYEIAGRLNYDSVIGNTGIIMREYIFLKELEIGINKFPFSNEYRIFCYKGQLLSWGFNFSGVCEKQPEELPIDGLDLARKVARIVGEKCSYYTIDIAEKSSGGWIVIELNEGQCSGISGNRPETLYSNLLNTIEYHQTKGEICHERKK